MGSWALETQKRRTGSAASRLWKTIESLQSLQAAETPSQSATTERSLLFSLLLHDSIKKKKKTLALIRFLGLLLLSIYQLFTWGWNQRGTLGHPQESKTESIPSQVKALADVKIVQVSSHIIITIIYPSGVVFLILVL